MFLGSAAAQSGATELLIERRARRRWGVDSETRRLTDVLLSPPAHLQMVPCNAVTRDNLARGLSTCTARAGAQHRALAAKLEAEGVACHVVPPEAGMPDLAFTRDSVMMSPWGLIALRPAELHRAAEARHVVDALLARGLPYAGSVEEGRIEGGDVCMLRPGVLLIGHSGERTDETGARALARLFEREGWTALLTRFDPRHLHLDTQFTMISSRRAVACLDTLEPGFAALMADLGISLVRAGVEEVERLEANLLSLGGGRIVVPAGGHRLNRELARLGFDLIEAEIDQFARCGGGIHCLTMPLARAAA